MEKIIFLLLLCLTQGLIAQEKSDYRSLYTSAYIHPYILIGGEDGLCAIQNIDSRERKTIALNSGEDVLDIVIVSDSIYFLCSGGSIYRMDKALRSLSTELCNTIPIRSKSFSYYTSHPSAFPIAAGGSKKIFDRKINLPLGKVVSRDRIYSRPFRFFFTMDDEFIYGSNGFNTKAYTYKNNQLKCQAKYRGIIHHSVHPRLLCGSTGPRMKDGMLIINDHRITIPRSGMIWSVIEVGDFLLACTDNGHIYKYTRNGMYISTKQFSKLPIYTIQPINNNHFFIGGSGGYNEIIELDF